MDGDPPPSGRRARPSTLPSEPNVVLVAQLMDAESAYTSPALNRLAELCSNYSR